MGNFVPNTGTLAALFWPIPLILTKMTLFSQFFTLFDEISKYHFFDFVKCSNDLEFKKADLRPQNAKNMILKQSTGKEHSSKWDFAYYRHFFGVKGRLHAFLPFKLIFASFLIGFVRFLLVFAVFGKIFCIENFITRIEPCFLAE